jgi:hypothetical protein
VGGKQIKGHHLHRGQEKKKSGKLVKVSRCKGRDRIGGKQAEYSCLQRMREKGREENNLLEERIARLMREGMRKVGIEMSVQWRNRKEKGMFKRTTQ